MHARPVAKFATIASDRPALRGDLADITIPLIARAASLAHGRRRPDDECGSGGMH
jgi:hypothetical protein